VPTKLLLVLISVVIASAETTLSLAPNGNDAGAGTRDQPLKTLAAARDRARTAAKPVTVLLEEGTYELTAPLVLDRRDSYVTWTARDGARAIVSGGRRITGWTRASNGAWTATIPEVRDGRWYFRQLFVNGRRAIRARTPNFGFLRADGAKLSDTKPFQLRFRGDDIKQAWAEAGDVEVVALYDWADVRMPIRSVDEQAHRATLGADPLPYTSERDGRYYIENAPDALDRAGEWYLDRRTGVLSYRPLAGEDMTTAEVSAPALTSLVQMDGAEKIVFRGLTFRDADWDIGPNGYATAQAAIEIGAAVRAVGASECAFERCTFEHLGGYAIELARGCRRNRIAGNVIRDIGAGGIRLGEGKGGGDVAQSVRAELNTENVISDNDVHDLGIVFPSAVGVWIGQDTTNATIAHNHLHDLNYTAISVCWSWGYAPQQCDGHLIEYNHIDHVGRGMMSDLGGIYTLGPQPHTVLRNNLIHDISAFYYGGWGIYLDEGSTGILVENNIVYRAATAAFNMHYGRENLIRNNVFAGGETTVSYYRVEDHLGFTLERNILYNGEGPLLGLAKETSAAECGAESTASEAHKRTDCRHYRLTGNVYRDSLTPRPDTGSDPRPLVADPGFVNEAEYDFRLLPDAPALKAGFQPIDMSGVGPRRVR
jgi:hypothetical protein